MKENRLVYMAGEGTPGTPGGQGVDPEQAQKILAEAAGMLPALKEQADRLRELAGKPQEDRKKLKEELEGKVVEKERLYSEISKALDGKVLPLPDSGAADFESKLKVAVKEAIPVETVISEDVLKTVSVATAIEAAKAKEMLIDIFAEDVFVKVRASEGLTGKKSFKVEYENKNIVVELSGKSPNEAKTEEAKPAESEAETRAKSQVEAAKKELSGNQSLMTVLGFFGLVKNKEDGNPDLDTAVKDPVVKFVSWLFGAEFAKGAIDPLVKAASAKWPGIGEKIEGWKTELQGVLKSVVPEVPKKTITTLLGELDGHPGWENKGLEESVVVKETSSVLGGNLIIDIPPGKVVDLKLKSPTKIRFKNSGSSEYSGPINGGRDGLTLKLVTGDKIPEGATFDAGVKIWLEKEEKAADAGEKTTETADKAVEKEAPEEKPAT